MARLLPPAFKQPHQTGSFLPLLGRPGMGKTYRAKLLAAELLELRGPRAIVLIQDPHGQYPGTKWPSVEAFSKSQKWPRVNVFQRDHACAVLAFAVERVRGRVPVIVVVDELDRLCRGGKLVDQLGRKPGKGEYEVKSPTFQVLTEHRHLRIDLVGGVRRPMNLSPDFRANFTALTVFRVLSPEDAAWVRSVTGSSEMEARAMDLPPRQCVVFDPSDISDAAPPPPDPRQLDLLAHRDGKIKK